MILILVVVDNGLVQHNISTITVDIESLNPYCSGQ